MFSRGSRVPYAIATSGCAALLLLALALWHGRRAAMFQAADELATCQQLAADIESFRAAPKSALLEQQTQQQVSLSIERAAQLAEIPDADILRITPLQGRRVGKSAYVQQPTVVPIRQATLGQVARFLDELSVAELGLRPVSIRLTAPREPPPGNQTDFTERWACEFVLTYLVFSPE